MSEQAPTRHGVHGLVGVELIGATPAHRRGLTKQLGPSGPMPSQGPADIVVRFVERLPRARELTYLGSHAAAYDGEAFYLADGHGALSRIDLAQAGQPLEIVCERRVARVPLLIELLSLRLIERGRVLVHAASFVHRRRGVLVAGWEGGGKSELLLPFMAAGADYLADEWTIVGGTPTVMHGLAADAQIWDWQLRQLPSVRRRLARRRRAGIRVAASLQRLSERTTARSEDSHPAGRLLAMLEPGFRNNARASASPATLYGDRVASGPAALDVAFLATVVADPVSRARPIAATELAERMVWSLAHERRALATAYDGFRFAFPQRRSEALERAPDAERALLERALCGCRAFAIEHPKPLVLRDLYDVARPLCEA